ncbi:MAG: winged helix-turn-helix transcriptional regulator [Leptospiraceae bacterium]|nr:winged helix-turn-helix transcriptional regulator [Leptospiraceae bacterium]
MQTDKVFTPEQIIYLISKIKDFSDKFLDIEMQKHGLLGLSTSHGSVLFALYKHGKQSMNVIADLIGKDKATLTALVKKLEEKNLVKKTKNPDDSRSFLLELTDEAMEKQEMMMSISKKLKDLIYKDFSRKDKVAITRLLTRSFENMKKYKIYY